MRNYFNLKQKNNYLTNDIFTAALSKKVSAALVRYVYAQTILGMFASTFCASIVFLGFYADSNNSALILWLTFFLLITFLRMVLVVLFEKEVFSQQRIHLWQNLYIIGAACGGASWGLASLLLFPGATAIQKTLTILMLAGVTAGAIPLSSAMPIATISFLIFSLIPFIISILFLKNYIFYIFDAALTVYLGYTIALTIKSYKLIKNTIQLQFENEVLLENLYDAKNQLEITNKMLEQAATHDPLTGVANRSLFQLNLEQAILRAKKNKKGLALFYIDLDRFKLVNDIYGHHMGDQLLLVIVNRLKMFFGSDESIARLGGDEFTLILENVEHAENVAHLAEQLCQLVARPLRVNHIGLKISASIGISFYPRDGEDARELLWYADKSMYYVKERGGNSYHFTEEVAPVND